MYMPRSWTIAVTFTVCRCNRRDLLAWRSWSVFHLQVHRSWYVAVQSIIICSCTVHNLYMTLIYSSCNSLRRPVRLPSVKIHRNAKPALCMHADWLLCCAVLCYCGTNNGQNPGQRVFYTLINSIDACLTKLFCFLFIVRCACYEAGTMSFFIVLRIGAV